MVFRKCVYDSSGSPIRQLVQFDHDIYIYIKDKYITEAHPVHFFSTKQMDVSLVVDETELVDGMIKVKIPNKLLETDGMIIGFLYIPVDDEGERSIVRFEIDILPKPIPSDYIEIGSEDYYSAITLKKTILDIIEKSKFVFSSYEDAVYYAENDKDAYIGQPITVHDTEKDEVTVYVVSNSNMELSPVGGASKIVDYNSLENMPQINGTVLVGNLLSSDIGIDTGAITNSEIEKLFND